MKFYSSTPSSSSLLKTPEPQENKHTHTHTYPPQVRKRLILKEERLLFPAATSSVHVHVSYFKMTICHSIITISVQLSLFCADAYAWFVLFNFHKTASIPMSLQYQSLESFAFFSKMQKYDDDVMRRFACCNCRNPPVIRCLFISFT